MYDPSDPLHREFISLVSVQLQRAYHRTPSFASANNLGPDSNPVRSNSMDEVIVGNTNKSEEELVNAILSQLESSTSVAESLRAVTFQPQQFEKVFYFIYYLLLKRPLVQILTHLGLNFLNPT